MPNVTYYLGAGASIESLPLYTSFQERLKVFRDYIFHFSLRYQGQLHKGIFEHYILMLDELIELLDPNDYSSVDVLAHELFLSERSSQKLKFFQLKYLLSDFFVFEQLDKNRHQYLTQIKDTSKSDGFEPYSSQVCTQVNCALDKRYRSFILPSLLSNKFPPWVNFISWNYDLQIELAYAKIRGISINLAQSTLQVFPSPELVEIDEKASSIIKVNGTAGIYFKQNSNDKLEGWINEGDFIWNDEYVKLMVQVFYNNSGRIMGSKPSFKFYFEEPNQLHNRTIESAKKIMSKTEVLVVIGYSFHPSNRRIDQEILSDFSELKKVIIQTQVSDYDLVKNNLKNIIPGFNGRIELYKDLRNFPAFNNLGDLRSGVGFATSNAV